jgi:glycosyltransferase involved in cell wall biosynthesis
VPACCWHKHMQRSRKPYRVLFMQSQTYYGADSRIHGVLMRHFDRRQADVHVALNYGDQGRKSASAEALEKIPDLHIRPTNFGTSINERTRTQIMRDTIRSGGRAVYSLASLVNYIRKNQINIIHCTEKPRDAFYGYLLSRMTSAKCVIHLHVKAENWISKNVQWAMHRADALIGVSQFVADSMREMGFPPEKIFFAYNSLELDEWKPDVNIAAVRAEFNVGHDVPLLSIVSRLFYWKGHSELFEALAKVKQTTPNFKLLVVGENDPRAHPGGGSYLDELKNKVQLLGLSDQVIFTGYRSDARRLFAASDIYTMPSFEEPFGMVFLEAMAMNKPVIALDNGGSREIIEHGVSGLLSMPKDIDALAENILTLIQNPALRAQMGACGRAQVETRFTPAQMCADVLRIYQKILTVEDYPYIVSGKSKEAL